MLYSYLFKYISLKCIQSRHSVMIYKSKIYRMLPLLFVLILLVKALILFVLLPHFSDQLGPFYCLNKFVDNYNLIAHNLAIGNGYRFYPSTAVTLFREPGYPIFLATTFLLLGYSLTAAKVANFLLSVIVAYLIIKIAKKVTRDNLVIIGAPILYLFHPAIIIAESRGGFEILFILFLCLLVISIYRSINSNRNIDYLVTGCILGITTLIKSTFMLFPIFLIGYLFILERSRLNKIQIVQKSVIVLIAMLLVMSPWIIRNYLLTGLFIPTATVKGTAAFHGQYICKNLTFENRLKDVDREAAKNITILAGKKGYEFKKFGGGIGYYQFFYKTKDEVEFNNFLWEYVVKEYRESPLMFVKCVFKNMLKFWFAGRTWSVTLINMLLQLPMIVLAIIGTYKIFKEGNLRKVVPLLWIVLYFFIVYSIIHAQARYSVPLIPFMSILACLGVRQYTKKVSLKEHLI